MHTATQQMQTKAELQDAQKGMPAAIAGLNGKAGSTTVLQPSKHAMWNAPASHHAQLHPKVSTCEICAANTKRDQSVQSHQDTILKALHTTSEGLTLRMRSCETPYMAAMSFRDSPGAPDGCPCRP